MQDAAPALRAFRIGQADSPAGRGRRFVAARQYAAVPAVHEVVLSVDELGGAVEGVAFADAAEVDFEALPGVRDGLPLRIEMDMRHADAFANVASLGG